jgi:hypothetical protein
LLRQAEEPASFEIIPAPGWRAVSTLDQGRAAPEQTQASPRGVVYWVLHGQGQTEEMWVFHGAEVRDSWQYLAPGRKLADFA